VATAVHQLKGGGVVKVYWLTDALEQQRQLSTAVIAAETADEVLYLGKPQTLLIIERRRPSRVMVYEFDESVAGRETCYEVVAAIVKSSSPGKPSRPKGRNGEGGGGSGAPLMPALQVSKV
jgi:hypothetical protein